MSAVLALVAAQWRVTLSYRVQTVLSFATLAVTVVPLYFIADALQPVMANAIRGEGGNAFSFLLVGTAAISVVAAALSAVPTALGTAIGSGTLEALLGTPASPLALVTGLGTFPLLVALVRSSVLLASGLLFGAHYDAGGVPAAVLILALILLSHLAVGLIGAGMVLAFRTAGPLARVMLLSSSLLGGVYYPASVVPSWLRAISDVLPLTYGLRALRRVLLDGAPLGAVGRDMVTLAGETSLLLALGLGAIAAGFRYARHQGTLTQY